MRTCLWMMAFALLFNLAACSGQQAYGIGQAWQRHHCFQIDDARERSRCLESAETSYQQYKRQSEGAP